MWQCSRRAVTPCAAGSFRVLTGLRPVPPRYADAGGRYYVCPICFNAKKLDEGGLVANAELAGTVPLWEWIGDDGATTFSY